MNEDTRVWVANSGNWGHGHYDYQMKRWTYHLVGISEQDDNKITHWAKAPVLPSVGQEVDTGERQSNIPVVINSVCSCDIKHRDLIELKTGKCMDCGLPIKQTDL